MATDLKALFGQIDKDLLHDHFESKGCALELDWQQLPKNRYGGRVFDAWLKLPAENQQQIEPDLLEVNRLAQERGVRGMIQAAAALGVDLIGELDPYEGCASKILHVISKRPSLWDQIRQFVELDILVTKRFWLTFPGFPKDRIDNVDERAQALKEAVASFYRKTSGKGRISEVRHCSRGDTVDYFFIYLDSYSENGPEVVGANRIDFRTRRPVFDVVFILDRTTGELSLMAKGGRSITNPLYEIFCQAALKIEPPVLELQEPPYQLNGMLNSMKGFPTDPIDGIEQVIVQGLRLWTVGSGKRRIGLDGDPEQGTKDVYAMVEQHFRTGSLSAHTFRVAGVKFKLIFMPGNPIGKRSVTFEVSHPRTDSFKDEPEAVKAVIRRCLRRWELDVTQPVDNTAATAESEQAAPV